MTSRMRAPGAALVVAPVLGVELVFLASNALKIGDGGYVPVIVAAVIGFVMWAWWRGTQAMRARVLKLAIPVTVFVRMMRDSSVSVIPGTAFFLTGDPGIVPSALLHNIKHNRVLHEQTVLLTVETLRMPYATAEERVAVEKAGFEVDLTPALRPIDDQEGGELPVIQMHAAAREGIDAEGRDHRFERA